MTADQLSAPGSSQYDSGTMQVGDGTWDATDNTFLLPNLVGLNLATTQYNGRLMQGQNGAILTRLCRHGKSLQRLTTLPFSHHRTRSHSMHNIPPSHSYLNPNRAIRTRQKTASRSSTYMDQHTRRVYYNSRADPRMVRRGPRTKLDQPSSCNWSCSLYACSGSSTRRGSDEAPRETKGSQLHSSESHGKCSRRAYIAHMLITR